jgi:hypothetical protein
LYGCETWTFILKEGHRPRVFENSTLRKIFGPKKDQITEGHGDFQNLFPLTNNGKIKEGEMNRACST